jgi:hypothetical protein
VQHPRPSNESEKYVGLIFDMKIQGAYIGYSPDGIHWKNEPEPFWQTLCDIAGWGDDSIMCLIYDTLKGKLILNRRVNPQESDHLAGRPSDVNVPSPDRGMCIMSYAESSDLKHWENHKIIMTPDADDPADVQFYGLTCYNYADVYVGYFGFITRILIAKTLISNSAQVATEFTSRDAVAARYLFRTVPTNISTT